jgi:ABC-2 type transport system permease protein
MNFRVVLAIARKDARDVLLDKSAQFGLVLPILLSLMYAIITTLVNQAIQAPTRLLVYDPGGSGVAQAAAGVFSNVEVRPAGSAAEVAQAFSPDSTQTGAGPMVGLIVPADFDAGLRAGNHPALSLYIDEREVSPMTAQLLQAAIENYGYRLAGPQPPFEVTRTAVHPQSYRVFEFDHRRYFTAISILLAMMAGTWLIASLLIEEKEKKTLRMLMVTPASLADVVVGKLLVALFYQLVLTAIVLAIHGGVSGQVYMIGLYVLLGAGFSLSIGLLLGALLETISAANAVVNTVSTFYMVAAVFSGPFGPLVGDAPFILLIRLFPTHHLANGVYSALRSVDSFGSHLPGLLMLLGSTFLFVLLAIWALRRQPSAGRGSALTQITN